LQLKILYSIINTIIISKTYSNKTKRFTL